MTQQEKNFTRMVKEQKGTIYTVCLMFSDSPEEVDDLVQQVLINLWQGYADVQQKDRPRSWVWRVAMNTCISADRRARRQPATNSLESIGLHSADMASDNADDRQIRLLHDRIHRLGLFDRAIVLLWLEDLSYEEIASIVGISAKNVSVRLVRIREQLKHMNEAPEH